MNTAVNRVAVDAPLPAYLQSMLKRRLKGKTGRPAKATRLSPSSDDQSEGQRRRQGVKGTKSL